MQLEENEAESEIDRLLTLSDHHDAPFELAERFSKTEDAALADLISPLALKHPALNEVRETANNMLDLK